MSEITENTNKYRDENGYSLKAYGYLNTKTGQLFLTTKKIESTTNVSHLVRVSGMDTKYHLRKDS